MKTVRKVPITMRALTQRINRKLAEDDEQLKKAGSAKSRQEVGDYFIINVRLNAVVRLDVDPEALGHKLGVLREWESVQE